MICEDLRVLLTLTLVLKIRSSWNVLPAVASWCSGSLLRKLIQLSPNSGSAQVQTLLVACFLIWECLIASGLNINDIYGRLHYWNMEVFEDLLEVSDSCEFGSCFKRRRVQSQIVSFRSQRGRGSGFYYYGFYVSVSFLRLHKTCLRQKRENCIFFT